MLWSSILIPAAIGAITSMASNRNPFEGAAIGGVTGGLLGGFDFGSLGSALGDKVGSIGTALGEKVATTTPVLGGQTLSGATTGLIGDAGANAIASSATPLMTGSTGEVVSPLLTNAETYANLTPLATENVTPSLLTASKGTPIDYNMGSVQNADIPPILDSKGAEQSANWYDGLNKQSTAMLATQAAQNLLNPQMTPIQVPQTSIKQGALKKGDGGDILNVLSPSDYGASMATDNISVTEKNSPFSLFPERQRGFGGYGMFYK